jgi:hypothetical protein
MICAAVRKKGSQDQCSSKVVFGHTLCGRHARAKNVTLWADLHKKNITIVNVQALVRGWLVRNRLTLAGPGVLRRQDVANEEDLVSCASKSEVHPHDYFAFMENGKIWWFEFPSLWNWISRSHIPTNPYTRTQLTQETLKRLHKLAILKWEEKQYPPEPPTGEERIRNRWNLICQVFANYGFGNIHPQHFTGLTRPQYITIVRMILEDIQTAMPDNSERRFLVRTYRCLYARNRNPRFPLFCSFMFLMTLLKLKDPYILAFTMMSALYRI